MIEKLDHIGIAVKDLVQAIIPSSKNKKSAEDICNHTYLLVSVITYALSPWAALQAP
jgi:hypothetical protein